MENRSKQKKSLIIIVNIEEAKNKIKFRKK